MIRALIVVDSANLQEAVLLLQSHPFSYSKEEAEKIFVPAGSPSGDKPATKYWLSGEIPETFWAACQQLCAVYNWAKCFSYNLESDPTFPYKKLSELGLKPLKSEI